MTGSALIGLGVAMFSRARFGLPPYDVMLSVLRDQLGVSLGQAGWALAVALLSVAATLGQFPRVGTLAYIVLNGIAVDAAVGLLRSPEPFALRIAFVGFGVAAIAAGVSLVVHSGNPGGAFELLMTAGDERGKDPIRIRTGLEVSLLVLGVVLGGDFGPATVVFAIAIGPVMRAGRQALDDHRAGRRHRVHATHEPPSRQLAGSAHR